MISWKSAAVTGGVAVSLAAAAGLWLAERQPQEAEPTRTDRAEAEVSSSLTEVIVTPIAALPPALAEVVASPAAHDFASLKAEWAHARTWEDKTRCADEMAALGTAEAVEFLVQEINATREWKARNELATAFRALSDPEGLNALLPALLGRFDRGSRVLGEYCDAIGRLAQADTVVTLEALHWQACNQPGQSLKIIRAIAAIRNEPAKRELMRLSARSDSEAMVAAANAALQNLGTAPPPRLTATR